MDYDIYEEFLLLTGFEENEMEDFLPEFRKASMLLGLNEEDMRYAIEERIPSFFDLTLKGVRMMLNCYVREAVDLTKAKEYKANGIKIIYGILPANSQFYYALKMAAPEKVYVGFPDIILAEFLNSFFHKLSPLLEEAEKAGLSYGCRHCALNKTRVGARKLNLIPSPDISWIWGLVCDEGPKTDELIRCDFDPDWKTHVTRIPHDQPLWTEEDENDERVEYLASQMRLGFEFVQKEIGINVPEETIKKSIKVWQRYVKKAGELNRLMTSDPQPISGLIPAMLAEPIGVVWNTGLSGLEKALDVTIQEVKQRVAKKEGILPKGAPKLMMHFHPLPLPWIPKMFEENGVGLPFSFIRATTRKQLAPPRFEDPYMAVAEAWLKRTSTINPGYKVKILLEQIETYGIDGVILGFADFDRWLGVDHMLMTRILQEKTDTPVFYIEGDMWDDRDHSPEALRTRVESIAEIVKMRKG